jgi:hypothetical protein
LNIQATFQDFTALSAIEEKALLFGWDARDILIML